ncbi:MAG: glycosyltransferase, partial [Chitinophagia bacterium]|nr:glycosyltransferase [Chitinophagia bacterium]
MKPLSFVIITYNRPDDMLALARNIAGLDRAEELLEEVIVVNNRSTADYTAVERFLSDTPAIPFRYIRSEENLGVSRGRNYAIRQGRAPILVMIDDDAEMGNRDCLTALMEAFSHPDAGRPRAVVSFKVLYYSTQELQVSAFPHKRIKRLRDSHGFETYYFAGGAHAITREAIERVGLYPEDFFYGMEEYDLSYRLLEAGYSIAYRDSIVMLHKESPQGRQPTADKLQMMWVNKSKVAWRYLPRIYFFSTALMWS